MSNPYGVYPITSYIPSKEEIGKLTEKYFPVSCIRILKKIIFDNLFYQNKNKYVNRKKNILTKFDILQVVQLIWSTH